MAIFNRNPLLAVFVISGISFSNVVSVAQTRPNYTAKAVQLKPQKVHMFSAENVRLLDGGMFSESQEAEAKNILSLNVDRLLSPYLKESGITPKAAMYPG